MTNELSLFDRATLALWRTINEAGWTILAFVLAAGGHIALTIWLTSRKALSFTEAFDLNARAGAEDGVDDIIAKFGLRIGLTLLIALVIGWIVGRKAWRHQVPLAALAALGYVLYVTIGLEYSAGAEIYEGLADGTERHIIRRTTLIPWILYDAVVAATVPLAALWARRVSRRRREEPAILRGVEA